VLLRRAGDLRAVDFLRAVVFFRRAGLLRAVLFFRPVDLRAVLFRRAGALRAVAFLRPVVLRAAVLRPVDFLRPVVFFAAKLSTSLSTSTGSTSIPFSPPARYVEHARGPSHNECASHERAFTSYLGMITACCSSINSINRKTFTARKSAFYTSNARKISLRRCAQSSECALTSQSSSFAFARSTPDTELFFVVERVLETLIAHDALRANLARSFRRTPALGEEDLRVNLRTTRVRLPFNGLQELRCDPLHSPGLSLLWSPDRHRWQPALPPNYILVILRVGFLPCLEGVCEGAKQNELVMQLKRTKRPPRVRCC
jgi:hypothetical protein